MIEWNSAVTGDFWLLRGSRYFTLAHASNCSDVWMRTTTWQSNFSNKCKRIKTKAMDQQHDNCSILYLNQFDIITTLVTCGLYYKFHKMFGIARNMSLQSMPQMNLMSHWNHVIPNRILVFIKLRKSNITPFIDTFREMNIR